MPPKNLQKSDEAGAIYQIKVTLEESEPPIWRRIQTTDCTLGELHDVLQVVMGWENSHLHQFIIQGKYYGTPDPDAMDWGPEMEDEEEIRLSQVARMGRQVRFTYEYDFGDSWTHEVVLEKIMAPEPKVKYPVCVDGARACPPEDVGGMGGYFDFLATMADPTHEEHEDMKEWVGGKFDSEKFAPAKVTKELHRVIQHRI